LAFQQFTCIEPDSELKSPKNLSNKLLIEIGWINDECKFKTIDFLGKRRELLLKSFIRVLLYVLESISS